MNSAFVVFCVFWGRIQVIHDYSYVRLLLCILGEEELIRHRIRY